jgi:hypothetical protein
VRSRAPYQGVRTLVKPSDYVDAKGITMARNVNPKGSSNPESPEGLTAGQVRAARALLDWSQKDLAAKSKLSVPTIKRMEGAMGPGRSTPANVDAVARALKQAGVVFLSPSDRTDGGHGVRLKK